MGKQKDYISWDIMENISSEYINHFQNDIFKTIEVKYPWVLVVFVSDLHIGDKGTDYKKARIDAEKISNCDYALAIGGGDMINNFILAKMISAVNNQFLCPENQVKLLQDWIEFFRGKLKLMISGNHEYWTKAVSGLDFLSEVMNKNNIYYNPGYFQIKIKNDCFNYDIQIRHNYRYKSSLNKTHTVKRMYKESDYSFDIGVVCHEHDPVFEIARFHKREVVLVRSGSYKVADMYSRQLGYNDSNSNLICVALNMENKKEMIPFYELDQGIEYINFKNEK